MAYAKSDKRKIALIVPFGHFKRNIMPFGLNNTPLEFHKIVNDIFSPCTGLIIVYIDNVLLYSIYIDQRFKHYNAFYKVVKNASLVVSAKKMNLFQTTIYVSPTVKL